MRVLLQGPGSAELAGLIRERVQYCMRQRRALDVRAAMAGVMPLLSSLTSVRRGKGKQEGAEGPDAEAWQSQLLLAFQLLIAATGTNSLSSLPPP